MSATNPVVATYAGDVNYSGSVSSTAPVNLAIVAKAATTTNVNVIPAGVIYGSEHSALITATVTPAFAGTPTGTVCGHRTTVRRRQPGRHLHHHPARVRPAPRRTPLLPAGATYNLSAAYSGDRQLPGLVGHATPGALTVSRATTTTSLVLSSSTVQYGISPVFTAAVSPTTSGTPTGTVAIIAYVSGSPVTLCTINLPATTLRRHRHRTGHRTPRRSR